MLTSDSVFLALSLFILRVVSQDEGLCRRTEDSADYDGGRKD